MLDLVAVTLFQLITSVSNCLSDREEDAIDYPERTRLCQSLGYGFMRDAVIASTAAYLAVLGVMTWVVDVPLDTIIIAFLGLLASFSYSFLRLKRHPLGAPSLLGPMSGLSLWVGWHGSGGDFAFLDDVHLGAITALDPGALLTGDTAVVLPSAIALALLGATLCGSKDVPNLAGDAAVGFKSLYLQIVTGKHPLARVLSIVSVPYLFVAACVAAGYEPPYLWILLLYPAAIGFSRTLVRAGSPAEGLVVREVGYLYWQLFMSAVLIAVDPTPLTAGVLLASACWWLVSSRWLHPDPTPITTEAAALGWQLAVGADPSRSPGHARLS